MSNPNLLIDEKNRLTETQIKIKIPQKLYQTPIVSRLASDHHLEVNILGALLLLSAEGANDGWFDLQLRGHSEEINNALMDLAELDVEVWYRSGQEIDGW